MLLACLEVRACVPNQTCAQYVRAGKFFSSKLTAGCCPHGSPCKATSPARRGMQAEWIVLEERAWHKLRVLCRQQSRSAEKGLWCLARGASWNDFFTCAGLVLVVLLLLGTLGAGRSCFLSVCSSGTEGRMSMLCMQAELPVCSDFCCRGTLSSC